MDESYCPTTAAPDQLVVDTNHLKVVQRVLLELKIQDSYQDSIPQFDLELRNLRHIEPGKPETQWRKVSDLDPVLTEIRARLAGVSGGWTPVIGKNRNMTSTFGAYPQTQSQSIWNPGKVSDPVNWPTGDEGTGVRVGLVDTKIFRHDDLPEGSIIACDDDWFTKAETDTCYFEEGHGVFAAGLILQQAPRATVFAHAALGGDGKAPAWKVVKELANFLLKEPEQRVHLIVLASGCRTSDGRPPLILQRAIERLSPSIMIVAAAGNHGAIDSMAPDTLVTRNSPTWPAAIPGVVAVGIPEPTVTDLPDYSPKLPWVRCTVKPPKPHDTFVSTYLKSMSVVLQDFGPVDYFNTGYASWRGTSFAAAYLGGAIAAKMSSNGMDARTALDELDNGPVILGFDWPATPVSEA